MFRRIAGSISRILRPGAQNGANGSQSIQGSSEIAGRSGPTLSSVLENDSKHAAHKALREAMRDLSRGNVKTAAIPAAEYVQTLSSKPLSSLTVEELEMLGRAYYSGENGNTQDLKKAVEIWTIAAEKGSIESKFSRAQCLLEGTGVEKNLEEGFRLMLELSEKDDYSYAHYTIAKLYEKGQGTQKDETKAFEAYKKAALGGIVPSLHNLANAYAEGRGVEQSFQKARMYYEAAVEVGDPLACFSLGQWYYHGKGGLPVDKSKAFELQLKAAEREHPFAMFNIGTAYLTSDGVPQNYEQAQYWLWKAHNAKIIYASLNLAKMHLDGVGVKKDLKKAKEIVQEVADKNPVAKELLDEIEARLRG